MFGAVVWLKLVDEIFDAVPKVTDCSLAPIAQYGLELGERLLDGIDVRAEERNEAQSRACHLDLFPHRDALVAWQIIHDDAVAWPQFRLQHLGDMGSELCSLSRLMPTLACLSILAGRQSAPGCRATVQPCWRAGFRWRIALETLTPNRDTAPRMLKSQSIAVTTRTRNPCDSALAIQAYLLHRHWL